MPQPSDTVLWLDAQSQQVGPEPLETVVQRVRAAQIPPNTLVWWQGSQGWTPLNEVPGVDLPATPPPVPAGTDAVPAAASQALMSGMTDQELDDTFIELVDRSWSMYKETEFATSIDEAMLGGVITALVDCGFVLIDLTSAANAAPMVPGIGRAHVLRFEEPPTHARVTVEIEHLTPDPAVAKMIGHRAAAVIGYGERVPNFTKVGQALRQEVQSSFIASPEPGTVTFDADLSSGYVYAQIDLLMEIDRYVNEGLEVDHDLLRRHLASVIYTMKTFIDTRFGS